MPGSDSFDLVRISHLFEQYAVDRSDFNAFPQLLKFISQKSYLDVLRLFVEQATTPEGLAHVLNHMKTSVPDITFQSACGKDVVTESALDVLVGKEEIDVRTLSSVEDKVRFLLMLSYGKGTRKLKDEFGEEFDLFLAAYDQGKDVSRMYNELMEILRSRYEFLL